MHQHLRDCEKYQSNLLREMELVALPKQSSINAELNKIGEIIELTK